MLDPLRSITGNVSFYGGVETKESGRNGGHKAICSDGEVRLAEVAEACQLTPQAIRGFARKNKIEIYNGLLRNSDAEIIISHYANCSKL